VQRTIGFASGMACAIALGVAVAGTTSTKMIGVERDRSQAFSVEIKDTASPEPLANPLAGGSERNWLFNAADAPSALWNDRIDYAPYSDDYDYAAYDITQDYPAEADPYAKVNDSASDAAAAAQQAALEVKEAETAPAQTPVAMAHQALAKENVGLSNESPKLATSRP